MSHTTEVSRFTGLLCSMVVAIALNCNAVCSTASALSGDATEQETTGQIIEALRSHQVALQRFSMRIESQELLFDAEQETFQERETQVIDVQRRNEKLDLLITRFDDGKVVQKLRHIRTDSHVLSWQHNLWGQGSAPSVSIREARTVESTMAGTSSLERLIGFLGDDQKSLAEMMADSDRLSLGKQMERVDGFDCYVVEGSGAHGEYEIWVDPLQGYSIRQARIHKGPGDLLYGSRIQPKGSASDKMPALYELTVKDIRLHEFGTTYIPIHEVITTTLETHDGVRRTWRSVIRRLDIELDPPSKAGDFEMTEIPNGTHILNFDETDYGYGYEWRDGKVAPVFGGGATTIVGRIQASDMPTSPSDSISIEAEIQPLETVGDKETAGDASLPTPDSVWHEVKVSQDGLLRIEHVPAGRHRLRIKMLELIESGSYRILTDIDREIPVARSDPPQTIDLGVLTFPPIPRLEPGDLAPEFELRAIDGSVVNLSDYRGQFVLLDFWASWCGPCIAEFPHLGEVFDQFADAKRFTIIGLNSDADENIWKETVKKHGLQWTQLIMGDKANQITTDYVIYGIPAVFLVGPDGRIVARDMSGDGIDEVVSNALGEDLKNGGK